MTKLIYSLFLFSAVVFMQCGNPKQPDIKMLKKSAYDSARQVLLDSIINQTQVIEEYKKKQLQAFSPDEMKHNPPYDGHVHDGGYELTEKSTSQEYVAGIMERVIDQEHNTVVATLPFIVKKGMIKKGDDYLSDKNKHAHIAEYDVIEIPVIDNTGKPTGKTTLLAVIKKVIPK